MFKAAIWLSCNVIVRVHVHLYVSSRSCKNVFQVYNFLLNKQRNMSIYRNISIHRYIGCLLEIEIQIFDKYS